MRRAPIEPSTSATQRTTTPPNARGASAGAGAATMTSGGVPRGSAGVWMPLARQLLLGRSAGLTKLLSHGVWRLFAGCDHLSGGLVAVLCVWLV